MQKNHLNVLLSTLRKGSQFFLMVLMYVGIHAHAQSPKPNRSEEHTSELQSHHDLVCRLLLEKKHTLQRKFPVIYVSN